MTRIATTLSFFALFVSGCDAQEETSVASDVVEPRAAAVAPVSANPTLSAEETRRALAGQLRAHHTSDLPTPERLAAQPGAADALRWLAEHHELRVVRVRAVALLGAFPDPESEALVRRVLADGATPVSLRAAATRALAGWDLAARTDLQALARASLQSAEVAVAVAGAEVLVDVPGASDAVDQRRTKAGNPAALQRILDRTAP